MRFTRVGSSGNSPVSSFDQSFFPSTMTSKRPSVKGAIVSSVSFFFRAFASCSVKLTA